jgi:hypothetical protein
MTNLHSIGIADDLASMEQGHWRRSWWRSTQSLNESVKARQNEALVWLGDSCVAACRW